jgi:hypothetical protein
MEMEETYMEKVKITEEQKQSFDLYLDHHEQFEDAMDGFIRGRSIWTDIYKPLKNITVSEFALILHGHYEVEKPCPIAEYLMKRRGEIRFEQGDQIVLSGDRYDTQVVGHGGWSAEGAKTLYERGRIVYFYPAEAKISKWGGL